MDIADMADRFIEDQLLTSLQVMQRKQQKQVGLSGSCEECGAPIPEARQIAVPGCSHCVSCAYRLERLGSAYSRNPQEASRQALLDDYLYSI